MAGAYNDTTYNGAVDDYLTVFDANTDTIKWTTYIGGNGNEFADVQLNYANRNMYLTGLTNSLDFHKKQGAHQYFDTIRGFSHFIMKFSL
ncbi:MAG: hypothetical protein IPL10_12440 [Bacteroidetes bacterium]|nr:hypothetical protein [Bacteroidota bacterium]